MRNAASVSREAEGGRGRGVGRQHPVGQHRGEGVAVAGSEPGRYDAGGGRQVVAERLCLLLGPPALEGQPGDRTHRRQPDPGVALLEGDRHLGGGTGRGVGDRRRHPLEGALDGTAERAVVARAPDDAVVGVERGEPHPGPGLDARDRHQRLVVEVLGIGRGGLLDVAPERRERRSVLTDVERRLDVVAQHQSVVVCPGGPGGHRQGEAGREPDQDRPRDGAQAADPTPELGVVVAHHPTVGAEHQPARRQAREAGALEPERRRLAYAEQDHRGQQRGRCEEWQQRGEEAAPGGGDGEPGRERSGQPGRETEQPRQREQRRVGVHRRQRGQQVLPAEHQVVTEQQRGRGCRRSAQGEGSPEQDVGEHDQHHRRDEGPAQHPGEVDEQHCEHDADHADHPESDAGEGRREPGQRQRGQRDEQPVVDPAPGIGQPATHRATPVRLQRSTAARSPSSASRSTGRPPASVTCDRPDGSTVIA